MTTCRGPKCTREGIRDGLCWAHYQQQRRGQKRLLEAMERAPSGTEQVCFRCDLQLLAGVLEIGKRKGHRTATKTYHDAFNEYMLRHAGDLK